MNGFVLDSIFIVALICFLISFVAIHGNLSVQTVLFSFCVSYHVFDDGSMRESFKNFY